MRSNKCTQYKADINETASLDHDQQKLEVYINIFKTVLMFNKNRDNDVSHCACLIYRKLFPF